MRMATWELREWWLRGDHPGQLREAEVGRAQFRSREARGRDPA
jgi:hypothetical protein